MIWPCTAGGGTSTARAIRPASTSATRRIAISPLPDPIVGHRRATADARGFVRAEARKGARRARGNAVTAVRQPSRKGLFRGLARDRVAQTAEEHVEEVVAAKETEHRRAAMADLAQQPAQLAVIGVDLEAALDRLDRLAAVAV